MEPKPPAEDQFRAFRKYLFMIAAAWTLFMAGACWWVLEDSASDTRTLAIHSARANFNKDLGFRLWATKHGGVYVPANDRTPPNPNLAHIKERDLVTPSGVKLTLMNPAYMLRQLMDEYPELYGVRGRIVSLKPFRPQNAPDPWEKAALMAFEKGRKEVMEFTEINGQPYLRLIRPMVTQKGCLKCHGVQGYKVGDVRGGVGVSVSMAQLLEFERHRDSLLLVSFMVCWLLGLGALGWVYRETRAKAREHGRAEAERRRLEQQLHQAEKMASIGTLAGGVAHEFNNILAAIMGYSELARDGLGEGDPVRRDIAEITKAAGRAKGLVRQILTFSRAQEVSPRPMSLNDAISDALAILKSAIPRMIELEVRLAPELAPVNANPHQVEQIIFNLVKNAADAIDGEGTITVATSAETLRDRVCETCNNPVSGDYALLSIKDTGSGMSPEVLKRIFDPFFTTKDIGKGTGLGLSTVYGIVTGSDGHIVCHSREGSGSEFRIYLPVAENTEVEIGQDLHSAQEDLCGGETILLVDDEAAIRDSATKMLERQGYTVLEAASAEEALELYRARPGGIDAVVMDLGMPGMGGLSCLPKLLEVDPEAKVLVSSGYVQRHLRRKLQEAGAAGLLAKPYLKLELLEGLRRTLDTGHTTPPAPESRHQG